MKADWAPQCVSRVRRYFKTKQDQKKFKKPPLEARCYTTTYLSFASETNEFFQQNVPSLDSQTLISYFDGKIQIQVSEASEHSLP